MESSENIALLITIGSSGFCIFIIVFVLFIVKYQKKISQNDKKLKALEFLQQIALFSASSVKEEKEKERIARNLHDEINPLLNVLKQNLQKHRLYIMKDKFDVVSFNNDFDLIDKVMEGIRNCSDDLVPSFLMEYGLITSLKDYIRSLNDLEIINATFSNPVKVADTKLTKHEQLNVYRICLELINNILKHENCHTLNLEVHISEKKLTIEITHDGLGLSDFDVDRLSVSNNGLGLKSLKARVLMLGATINYLKGIISPTIILTVPIKND